MSMQHVRTGLIGAGVLGMLAIPAQAVITELDSSAFAHKYEANDYPQFEDPIYTQFGGFTPSLNAGILSYDSATGGPGGGLWWDATATYGSEHSLGGAFTLEMRARVLNTIGDRTGTGMFAGGPTGDPTVGMLVGTDSVGCYIPGDEPVASGLDNSTDFHIFRMARDAGSSDIHFYRDNVEIGVKQSAVTDPGLALYFGDTGSSGGASSEIDYFRWTTAGAYAPVGVVPLTPKWSNPNSGDWNVGSNWSLGAAPNGVDAVANFEGVITSTQTVYTNGPVTVGTIKFDNANTYVIAGGGSLTIEVSTGSGLVSVLQGSQKINLPLFFASDTSVSVAGGATLTIGNPMTIRAGKTVTKSGSVSIEAPLTLEAGATLVTAGGRTSLFGVPSLAAGAKIDIKNNSVTVDYRGLGSVGTAIKNQIAANGIMSSSAISGQTGIGWKDDAATQSILVKYTYLGDTNLDGQVDVIDLGNLATAWQTAGVWVNGDSNYDNFIDVIDLGMLATNWQAGVGSPLGPGSLDQALAAYGLPSVSVPEPAALGLLGLCLAGGLRRQRRSA